MSANQNLWLLLSRVSPEITQVCLCLTFCQCLWQAPHQCYFPLDSPRRRLQARQAFWRNGAGETTGFSSLLRTGIFSLVGWRVGCEYWTSCWHKEGVLLTVYFTHKSSECLSDKRWLVPLQTRWYCGIGWGGSKRCLAGANVWAWRRACQILLRFIEVKKPWHSSSGHISQVRLKFCACSWLAFLYFDFH